MYPFVASWHEAPLSSLGHFQVTPEYEDPFVHSLSETIFIRPSLHTDDGGRAKDVTAESRFLR